MERITGSGENLMRQAPMTTNLYLDAAVTAIDQTFGQGYAKAHPELVAAYIKTCAIDLAGSIITSALQDIAEAKQ